MNKKLLLFLLALVLLAGGYYFFTQMKIAKIKQMQAQAMAGFVPEVVVVNIKKEQVQTYRDLPARVAAYRIADVRPQVEGIIKEKKFTEGSLVREGDQLYQIDPKIYDIALKNAKTSYDRMRARHNRYRALYKEDAISRQELEDSQADFAAAEAEYNLALNNSNYAKVLAPISGYVGKTNVTEGTLVTANQTTVLTTITQLDPIFVDMIQPSHEATKSPLLIDSDVSILIDDEKYAPTGKLKLAEKFADEATDSVRLRSEFPNPDGKLIPGMFVTAKIHLPTFEGITVPQRATSRLPNGVLAVFVVENGIAKQRLIKTSQIVESNFVVTEGLNEGDMVVLEGIQKLADGAPVKIAQPQQAQSTALAKPQEKK